MDVLSEKRRLKILLVLGGLIVVAIVYFLIFAFDTELDKRQDKIGFIILGDIREKGWNESHYSGIKATCDDFGLELLVRDNVPENSGQCPAAIEELVAEGARAIFLDQMMPNLDGIQTLKLAMDMPENKSKNAPTIALTANAISGAKEMFLREGFSDYLSKPIEPKNLEKMLVQYLPPEKVQSPTNKVSDSASKKVPTCEYLNVELGMQYSGEMPDMYKTMLEMFCNLKADKKAALQKSFDVEDWKKYTIQIHALKSTSLSIGGERLSEFAKQLEHAGKTITDETANELDKSQHIEFIKANHSNAMTL